MKTTHRWVLTGMVWLALAQAAIAATPFASHDATLNIAGSTAGQNSLALMMEHYCDASQPRNIYEFGGNSSVRAIECKLKPSSYYDAVAVGAKGLTNRKILLKYTTLVNSSLAGSILGVQTLLQGIPIAFVRVENACVANGTDTVTGFSKWNCPYSDWLAVEAGISDVEPGAFKETNTLNTNALTPTVTNPSIYDLNTVNAWAQSVDNSKLDSLSIFALGFGIAATDTLKAAGVTSLSRAHIQSILSGNVENWSELLGPAISGPIKVCRLKAGDGVQGAVNAYFNSNPCQNSISAVLPVATASDTGPVIGTLTVVENATPAGVKICLNSANAAGEKAIGLLSLENNEVVAGWDFIGINGINPYDATEVPTPADGTQDRIREDFLVDGRYDFFSEPTMQWRKPSDGSVSRTINGLTYTVPPLANLVYNSKLSLAQLIRENVGNPKITKALPGVLTMPKWWLITFYPYSAARGTAAELSQGITNYTRDDMVCKPANYFP